jgi:hypothetical protein
MSILSVKSNIVVLGVLLSLTIFSCGGNRQHDVNSGHGDENHVHLAGSQVPAHPISQVQEIRSNKLRFVAGVFNTKWTEAEGADVQWQIEDRFPFITNGNLLFLETGDAIQRVSAIQLSKLVTKKNGFFYEDVVYPSREEQQAQDIFDVHEPPMILAMYRGNAVLEEDSDGQRLISLSNRQPIKTSEPIRDYLNIRGEEWLVYPKRVVKRGNFTSNIFECDSGVFSVDVQNKTIAVGYKNSDNESKVCVWKDDGVLRDCDCATVIDNATNPVLSPDGDYLAVAAHFNKRWDLKVGTVGAFSSSQSVVKDIKFHDIKVKKVFYQNSYAWGGNTLFFTKRDPVAPYKITCQSSGCDEQPQSLEIPKSITVCGIKDFVSSKPVKDNQSLWFKANNKCRFYESFSYNYTDKPYKEGDSSGILPTGQKKENKHKYNIDSLKWGQPFFIKGKAYLATESLIESVGSADKWTITRILIFAIE